MCTKAESRMATVANTERIDSALCFSYGERHASLTLFQTIFSIFSPDFIKHRVNVLLSSSSGSENNGRKTASGAFSASAASLQSREPESHVACANCLQTQNLIVFRQAPIVPGSAKQNAVFSLPSLCPAKIPGRLCLW